MFHIGRNGKERLHIGRNGQELVHSPWLYISAAKARTKPLRKDRCGNPYHPQWEGHHSHSDRRDRPYRPQWQGRHSYSVECTEQSCSSRSRVVDVNSYELPGAIVATVYNEAEVHSGLTSPGGTAV